MSLYDDSKDLLGGLVELYSEKQQLDATVKINEANNKQEALNRAIEYEQQTGLVPNDPRLTGQPMQIDITDSGGVSLNFSLNNLLLLGLVGGAVYMAMQ